MEFFSAPSELISAAAAAAESSDHGRNWTSSSRSQSTLGGRERRPPRSAARPGPRAKGNGRVSRVDTLLITGCRNPSDGTLPPLPFYILFCPILHLVKLNVCFCSLSWQELCEAAIGSWEAGSTQLHQGIDLATVLDNSYINNAGCYKLNTKSSEDKTCESLILLIWQESNAF